MSNTLTLLRVLAPMMVTTSVIAVVALNPHSAAFAFWLTLPVNADGWRVPAKSGYKVRFGAR